MGERDESLDFILSFYPDVLHPYEFIAKSSAPKVKTIRFRNSVGFIGVDHF